MSPNHDWERADIYQDENAKLRAENERLRESCIKIALDKDVMIERHMREKVALAALVSKERDDNERLRAALQQIADDGRNCADHCRRQARRALEPKP